MHGYRQQAAELQGKRHVHDASQVSTTPVGLTVSSRPVSDAFLVWNGIYGAQKYNIYRDGELVGETAINNYFDSTLAEGTYNYMVSAVVDGEESEKSVAASVDIVRIEKLTGTVIGTTGSWNNNSATTRSAAFDGKIDTYFDAAQSDGAWAGIDKTIYRDKTGYVYFGTSSGLDRYDGARMISIPFPIENIREKCWVSGIVEAGDDRLYVGNNAGLFLFDNSGRGWFSTRGGLCCYDPMSSTIITANMPKVLLELGEMRNITRWKDGTMCFLPLVYGNIRDLRYRYCMEGVDVPLTYTAINYTILLILVLLLVGHVVYCKVRKKEYIWKRFLPKPVKYQTSRIDPKEGERLTKALVALMNEKKPYLDANIQMSDFARMLGCSTHTLSQVFTLFIKRNYYDFISEYRIEEFKRLSRDPKYANYTITALSNQCGFRSRTPFLVAFKKFTGMTPKEWMKGEK